ncbi:MAG: ATP phosphoribosyltransferase, partial [Chloroflexota bacterium]
MTEQERVVVALPSKGALAEPTLSFLAECGLRPVKTSPRHYTARIPALPEVSVLFQRARDIVQKVADGTVDLGITG